MQRKTFTVMFLDEKPKKTRNMREKKTVDRVGGGVSRGMAEGGVGWEKRGGDGERERGEKRNGTGGGRG